VHPVLFRLHVPGFGPVAIYAYGVMLGLSLVVGWYLTLGLASRDGLPKEKMANNYVVTAISAVVASRVLYVLTNLDEFQGNWAEVVSFRSGGLVAYGGFLGGLAGSWVYLRRHELPLLPWADVAVPSLASGLMITRIGCYLFGCDFGRPLGPDAPALLKELGTFPHWPDGTIDGGSGSPAFVQHVATRGLSPDAAHSLPVHPTQLYESLVGLSLLVLLLWLRGRQRFRGQIFLVFAFTYGAARFALELVRDDLERGDVPPSLPEHVIVPGAFALFAAAFSLGIAPAIRRGAPRVAAQVASFVPAVAAYVAYAPAEFAGHHMMKLSTSQAIGLASGIAAAFAYGVLHRAALRNPAAAMALDLPPDAMDRDEQATAPEPEADRPTKKRKPKPEPPQSDSKPEPEREPESESESEREPEPESEREPESESESESESEPEPEPGPRSQPEPGPDPNEKPPGSDRS
jgi:phosphatidylglycerol:prolipoprotein diacylglycerol transferase